MNRFLISFFVFIYSLLFTACIPLIRVLAIFHRRLRHQLKDRPRLRHFSQNVGIARAKERFCIVFFCSSAGEYEQARPLIDRLQGSMGVYVHVFFFSRSGYEYAKARGEQVPYDLAVFDTAWHWGWIFSVLRPNATVVVRHELWPAFLYTASDWGDVFLLDASVSPAERNSLLRRSWRRQILQVFRRIFTVADHDREHFLRQYHLAPDQVVVTGDTKYDRVLERARQARTSDNEVAGVLGKVTLPKFVLGSAHMPDLKIALEALAELTAKPFLVVVPHDVSQNNVATMLEACQQAGYQPRLYSQLRFEQHATLTGDAQEALIVDQMGLLAEIYGLADLAYVGGALHHQVHNVLEPASHGIPLAYGPQHTTSPEALHLAGKKLTQVVKTSADLAEWIEQTRANPALGHAVLAEVEQMAGAADQIMQYWRQHLNVFGSNESSLIRHKPQEGTLG